MSGVVVLDLPQNTIDILKYLDQNVTLDNAQGFIVFGVGFEQRLADLIGCDLVEDRRSFTAETDKAQQLGLYVLSDKGRNFIDDLRRAKHIKYGQRAHDYFLALFTAIIGGLAGLISSVIFWIITKSK
jgi:hypothetical protein